MEPDKKIDCLGLACPAPILKTKKAIKEMESGQILEMIADDPGSVNDMSAWSKHTGNPIIESDQPKDGVYRFLVKKA